MSQSGIVRQIYENAMLPHRLQFARSWPPRHRPHFSDCVGLLSAADLYAFRTDRDRRWKCNRREQQCAGVERVRYIRLNEPTLLGTKLNLGASSARGRIIQKLDDDDYYQPEFLQTAVTHLAEAAPGSIVAWDCFLVLQAGESVLRDSGHGWKAAEPYAFRAPCGNGSPSEIFRNRWIASSCATLARRWSGYAPRINTFSSGTATIPGGTCKADWMQTNFSETPRLEPRAEQCGASRGREVLPLPDYRVGNRLISRRAAADPPSDGCTVGGAAGSDSASRIIAASAAGSV